MPSPLHEAAAEALVRLAERDRRLRVVCGPDPGPAAWLAEIRPDRILAVAGPTVRGAVCDGLRLAGCRAVHVLDRSEAALRTGGWGGDGDGQLVLGEHAAQLAWARRMGVTVVQPAWRSDVAPLLVAALDAGEDVLLRLHAQALPVPRAGQDARPRLGEHRVLHRGSPGLVIGAGATAAVLADVARMLAGRRIPVLAVDAHTIRPGTGIDAALTDRHLLVGRTDADQASALLPVPVEAGAPIDTMRAVLAALRALRAA